MRRREVPFSRDAVHRLRWFGLPAAMALAGLSFAQATAGVGLPIRWAAPLGPNFHAWQPEQGLLEERLSLPGRTRPDLERLRAVERRVLTEQPLSTAVLRLAAWSDARDGRDAAVLARARMIERITRRDPVVQLWLIEDAVRRDDLGGVLRRYDVLMRTQPDLRPPLLAKLTARLGGSELRGALLDYAQARNPWFPELLQSAGRGGQAEGAALLLVDMPALPDTAAYRAAYGAVVAALAEKNGQAEGAARSHRFALLRQLYPKLPGAGSPDDVSLAEADRLPGYAPLRWAMAGSPDREARLEEGPGGTALFVRSAALSRGEAASRVALLPGYPVALSWTRTPAGPVAGGSSARWEARCLDDGRRAASPNLLDGSAGGGILAMPYPCAAVRIALLIDGGTDGGAAVRLTRLAFVHAGPSGQAPASTASLRPAG